MLGRGGFGVVMLGEMGRSIWKPKSGTMVAVKQLNGIGSAEDNRKLALSLAQELHVWAGLAHPHIIPLVGFLLDDRLDKAWLISPYMENGNIRDYLNKHNPDLNIRLRMLECIARGVAYLHRRNLCHGDIKAANVLVDDDGQPKLCDFGLTKLMESGTVATTSTALKGTTRYMAPEFFSQERPARNKETDVWAWSCLGLEVLFDKTAYGDVKVDMVIMNRVVRGDPPLNMDEMVVDERIKQLFKRCWVAEPHNRLDMKACAKVLEEVLEKLYSPIKPDEPPMPVNRVVYSIEPTAASKTVVVPSVVVNHIPTVSRPLSVARMGDPRVNYIPVKPSGVEGRGFGPEPSDFQTPIRKNEEFFQDSADYRAPLVHLIDRPNWHYNFDSSLMEDYYKKDTVADLHKTIDYHRQVLLRHPGRHHSLQNLATSVWHRYIQEDSINDLYEASDLYRQSLLLYPVGHPDWGSSLQNLATSLFVKYRKEGDVSVLYETIELCRKALLPCSGDHPDRPKCLQNLAISLVEMYFKKGFVDDLHEAITLSQWALDLMVVGDPRRQVTQKFLEKALEIRSSVPSKSAYAIGKQY